MRTRITVAAVSAVLLGTVGWSAQAAGSGPAAATTPTSASDPVASASYVAVIDAGSSGSRIYLYQGRAGTRQVNVRTVFDLEPDVPGLSSFVDHPWQAGPHGVTPLLDALNTELADRGIRRADVPVHLLATAGMRTAQQRDPGAVRRIYRSSRAAIAAADLPVGGVRTISGKREGLYSWTDVNFLRGVFSGRAAPRGVVEVGGASSQVAFTTGASGRNVARLRIAGTTYQVFSVSFLGLGQNAARNAMLRPRDARVGSPCFPNNAAGAQPESYPLQNDVAVAAAASRFLLADCDTLAATTIRRTTTNHFNAAQTHGATVRSIRDTSGFRQARFFGLASIAYALADFDVTGGDEGTRLGRSLREVCGGGNAWPGVLAKFGGTLSAFSQNACINASYNRAWVLGRAGLDIAGDRFRPALSVAGTSLTWTRGFALLHTSA